MTKITRTSALTARHKDLGGQFNEYIRMAVPMTYHTDPKAEHDAVRDAAGMYDFTAFLKYRVKGPDASAVLNHAVTFDVTKIKPGQSKYGPFLRETGVICDDGIVFNLGNDEYMVVHGDGCARTMAELSAEGKDAVVEYDFWTHLISLQGPKALELLDPHTPVDLPAMKYFHHEITEIFGCPCVLSRTGFSGERGYEMFVDPQYACDVWDNILEKGKDMGVMACSVNSVFPLRMEAALLWRRFDLMENTPWEVNMGWSVHLEKGDFRGKDALVAAKGKERFKLAGIEVDLDHALAGGEKLMIDGKEVGKVHDKPAWSHRLNKSLAIVRLDPELTAIGTRLEVAGDDGTCTATVVRFPVYDTEKARTHQ
ncbi:aminomethyltransferase family protein [Desulfosarcina sp.]|uniref:aminomethyltransferase family protein n=1 Tax=Desulfosarcina sp. TaxID=2027861 RepID=UPI00356B42A3